jgi:hypothetical protein
MSTTTFSRNAVRIGGQTLRGPLLILLVSIVGFGVSRRAMTHLGQWADLPSSLAVLAAFAAAVAFRQVRYQDMSAALRITTRAIGIIVLLQVAFDAFGPFAGPPNILFGGHGSALYFRYAAMLGVVAGVAGLWRPSFLVPSLLYYVGWRELIGTVSGIKVVDTDYLGMIDVGYFGTLGAFVAICATSAWANQRLPLLRALWPDASDRNAARIRAFNLIWACAVGAHLGSYFWSGMTKIHVGGSDPLTWVLHNPTQTAIVIGLERGDNPLATFPHVLQAVWDGIIGSQPYLNFFVFGTQMLAPFAAISVPVLSVFCLLFDFFHVGVYATLGALFFFWIAMNLVIVAAAASFRKTGFTPSMKVVMALTTVFGHYVFYTNHLGWLDSAKLASPQFYAITRDNREVTVPSNYFGIYSYTIAQAAMYIPDGHFPFRLAGNILDPKIWPDGLSCGPQIMQHQETGVTLDAVKQMVINTDDLMRQHPAVKNDNLYYLYPHHMLPNPWVFTDFNNLQIDDIVAYEYVMDSVCLTLKDGRLDRDVHKRSTFRIDLRQP